MDDKQKKILIVAALVVIAIVVYLFVSKKNDDQQGDAVADAMHRRHRLIPIRQDRLRKTRVPFHSVSSSQLV